MMDVSVMIDKNLALIDTKKPRSSEALLTHLFNLGLSERVS